MAGLVLKHCSVHIPTPSLVFGQFGPGLNKFLLKTQRAAVGNSGLQMLDFVIYVSGCIHIQAEEEVWQQ